EEVERHTFGVPPKASDFQAVRNGMHGLRKRKAVRFTKQVRKEVCAVLGGRILRLVPPRLREESLVLETPLTIDSCLASCVLPDTKMGKVVLRRVYDEVPNALPSAVVDWKERLL